MLDYVQFGNMIKSAADLVGSTGTAGSVVNFIRNIHHKNKEKDAVSLQNLFCEIIYGAAAVEFNTRVMHYCSIGAVKAFWNPKQLKGKFPYFDFALYSRVSPSEQTHILILFYDQLFKWMEEIVRDQHLIQEEKIEEIFKDIAHDTCDRWKIDFAQAREEYPTLKTWFDDLRTENLDNQMRGQNLATSQRNGCDDHLYKRRVDGEYWNQSIRLGGTGIDISARPRVPDKRENFTDKDIQEENKWWEDLSLRLAQAPLFLIGPSGIGKSAFLVYLYETAVMNRAGQEFEGAFLLSLDTIISNVQHPTDPDGRALNNPEKSILLRHIACRSGGWETSRKWKETLRDGLQLYTGKPILLLLDGFNEMLAKEGVYPNIYIQLKKEIIALSNLDVYKYVRIILTSRVEFEETQYEIKNEIKNELEAQRSELSMMHFQEGYLKGISEDIPADIDLSDELKKLLKRPLYYGHIQGLLHGNCVPSNQYEALKMIYERMSEQCVANGPTVEMQLFRRCIFEFFFPIVAYYGWKNKKLTKTEISAAYEEFNGKFCRQMISDNPETQGFCRFTNYEMDIEEFLKSQEQLIVCEENQYVFSHQDYQDFLAAKYFLQRMDYMRLHLDEPFWNDENIASNLRPNTYGNDILALIYQALSFRINFVEYFRLTPDRTGPERIDQITPGHILWYNAAYQLSDLTGPAGFNYGDKERLKADTLQVLRPLTEYVYEESLAGPPFGVQPTTNFNSLLRKHIAEILMKSCEAYRKDGNLKRALQMTDAAQYVYQLEPDATPYIVKHNIAHIGLCDFKITGNKKNLASSLDLLLECATGTDTMRPQRYSCSMLSLLLISPQDVLKRTDEYQDFIARLPMQGKESIVLFAFWRAYDAIFNCDKFEEENDWIPRLYYVRQFLYLLAENRVQVCPKPDYVFTGRDFVDLKRRIQFGKVTIRESPHGAAPIPTEGNLRLIRVALNTIAGYEKKEESRSWINYLNGLVEYGLNRDGHAARDQFNKVLDSTKDIRTQLWLAYVDRDMQRMEAVHKEGAEIAQRSTPQEINSYSLREYYERDITALYLALQEQLCG